MNVSRSLTAATFTPAHLRLRLVSPCSCSRRPTRSVSLHAISYTAGSARPTIRAGSAYVSSNSSRATSWLSLSRSTRATTPSDSNSLSPPDVAPGKVEIQRDTVWQCWTWQGGGRGSAVDEVKLDFEHDVRGGGGKWTSDCFIRATKTTREETRGDQYMTRKNRRRQNSYLLDRARDGSTDPLIVFDDVRGDVLEARSECPS